jgi:hypothetical protein
MPVDYPKLHWHKHAFEDILAKGPTRHYSTKPNEKCHGPLRESYLWHTNKRDVGEQVTLFWCFLSIDSLYHSNKILSDHHHHLTVKYVRQRTTDLDEYHREVDIDAEDDHEPNIDKKTRRSRQFRAGHILLGSYHSKTSFEAVETAYLSRSDLAFTNFRKRLTMYLNITLPAEGLSLPSLHGVKFHSYDTVSLSCITRGDISHMMPLWIRSPSIVCSPLTMSLLRIGAW